jgi:uncharacterized protein (DUF488 family)
MSTVYTIGHSNKPISEFIAVLRQAGIGTVWDVRSRPYSRFNPQFNKAKLHGSLEVAGIGYRFMGDRLGGLAENHGWAEAVYELACTENTVIMCSEMKIENCHRHTKVEPDLLRLGVTVRHLAYPSKVAPADPQGQLF